MIRVLLSAPLCLHIRLSSRFPCWPEMWIVPQSEASGLWATNHLRQLVDNRAASRAYIRNALAMSPAL